tara:strand:- start:2391 stop:2963 length:573 start_codon:yes stop_codon:yes gene_type:complete
MDLTTAIETRRSISKMKETPVDSYDLEDILQAGCWAPTHYKTEPWRFHVFQGESRQILADIFAVGVKEKFADSELLETKLTKAKKAPFRAPVVIAVTCKLEELKQAPVWEEYSAVACAIQNMSLQAHALGLASIWRSGMFTDFKNAEEYFNIDTTKGERIMGYFYLGYSNMAEGSVNREEPDWQAKTTFY